MKQTWLRRITSVIAGAVMLATVFGRYSANVYAADNVVDFRTLDPAIGNYAVTGTATLTIGLDIVIADSCVNVDDINAPAGQFELSVVPKLETAIQGTTNVTVSFTYGGKGYTESFTAVYGDINGPTAYPDFDSCCKFVDIQSDPEVPSDPVEPSNSNRPSSLFDILWSLSYDDDDEDGEPMHVHDFQWAVVQAATETEDGVQALRCVDPKCGQVDWSSQQPIPHQTATAARNEQIVLNAAAGETINLDTKDSYSFNRFFIEKLMAHNTSQVNVRFAFDHENYQMSVAPGFDWTQTLNKDGWAGFMFIGSFPGAEIVKEAN